MEDFQERVVAEKVELDERIRNLRAFIGGPVFFNLSGQDRYLMSEQVNSMDRYSGLLEARIERFADTPQTAAIMEDQYAPVIVTNELIQSWLALADAAVPHMRPGSINWVMIIRSLIAEIGVLKAAKEP